MKKIKKGSKIKVLCGKNKGSSGVVIYIDKAKLTALVSGINLYKKHIKPSKERAGEVIVKEMPIHISNLSLLDN